MPTSLQGIAEKAKSHATSRFRHLYGRRTEARLQDGWRDIRKDAAYGVEGVSAQADEQDLDEHISDLVERLKRKSSRAKRVRRHDIPQRDGQVRPVGIPAVADKLRQLAVRRLLTAIDEQEFRRCR
jgi:RNA-directed DNA polymerase